MALIHARLGDLPAAIRVIEDFLAQHAVAGNAPPDLEDLLRRLKASAAS